MRLVQARYKVISLILVLMLTLPEISPQAQYATTYRVEEFSVSSSSAISNNCNTTLLRKVDEVVANRYQRLLLDSVQLSDFRDEIQQIYGEKLSLQVTETYVLSNDCYVGVYVPIKGGAGHSFYGIWYDKLTKQPVTTNASLFTFDNEGNVVAKIHRDGLLQVDAVITPEGSLVSGITYTQGKATVLDKDNLTQLDFFSCLSTCLDQSGVPGWVFTALGIACAAICVITVGVGCWACLILAAGLFGADVTICWFQCGDTSELKRIYLPIIVSFSQ